MDGSVKKKKIVNIRKINNTVFLLSFLIIIFFVSLLSYKVFNFIRLIPVYDIVVQGASPEVTDKIIEQTAFIKGKNILDINLNNLQKNINMFPWVYKSAVHRNLNGKLTITIVERNPYFLWLTDDGTYKVISSDNSVVSVLPKFPLDKLIVIEKGNKALELSSSVRFIIYQDSKILENIDKLVFNGYRWDIHLKQGIIIKLPEENIMVAYKKVILLNKKYNLLGKEIDYIDATSGNKIFVMPNNLQSKIIHK